MSDFTVRLHFDLLNVRDRADAEERTGRVEAAIKRAGGTSVHTDVIEDAESRV